MVVSVQDAATLTEAREVEAEVAEVLVEFKNTPTKTVIISSPSGVDNKYLLCM